MPSFNLILLMGSEKTIFEYIFFLNLPYMSPRQPIRLSDLNKSRMKRGGLLNKLSVKNDSAEIVNFHCSHYKSIETISCRSN